MVAYQGVWLVSSAKERYCALHCTMWSTCYAGISSQARHQIGPQQLSPFLSSWTVWLAWHLSLEKILEGSMNQGAKNVNKERLLSKPLWDADVPLSWDHCCQNIELVYYKHGTQRAIVFKHHHNPIFDFLWFLWSFSYLLLSFLEKLFIQCSWN